MECTFLHFFILLSESCNVYGCVTFLLITVFSVALFVMATDVLPTPEHVLTLYLCIINLVHISVHICQMLV